MIEGGHEFVTTPGTRCERGPMGFQHFDARRALQGEQVRYPRKRQVQFPVQQDLLQSQQLGLSVQAIAIGPRSLRLEQSDPVVVVQRAHRDAGEPGDLPYGMQLHVSHLRL